MQVDLIVATVAYFPPTTPQVCSTQMMKKTHPMMVGVALS